jgi:hypothetical protein
MFQQSKYDSYNKLWNNGTLQLDGLKRENYTLNNELTKTKKNNDLLQRQKRELENRLRQVEQKSKIQVPEEIEKLLDKVDVQVKNNLYLKIEELLRLVTCVVCNESVKSVVFSDCRHLVACVTCGEKLDSCPLCRKISNKVCVYR